MKKDRAFTIKESEFVMHNGKKMFVKQILSEGNEPIKTKRGEIIPGEKDEISACRVMPDNGQVLHRSPIYIGKDWEYCC